MKRPQPTLKQVAESAGVSTATVSFVLNKSKAVSSATRIKVENALAKLDYRISSPARALRTGRHQAIGLLLPDLANPFFPGLAQAVTESAWQRGHAVILASSRGADPAIEAEALTALEERTDGIIWIPGHATPRRMPECATVVLDRPCESLAAFDSVSADHYAGGRAVAALARTLGHRRVGLFTGPAISPSAESRRAGFLDHAAGLDIVWQRDVPFALELPDPAAALLADSRIDLVVAASDVGAIAALRVLRRIGRAVPSEVSLIGFDDIPWAALSEPPLTTIRQPVAELGEAAVAMLLERIGGQAGPPRHRLLPVSVVQRATTAAKLARAA